MLCIECNTPTDNPKFCSRSCSAKYNNRGVRRHGKEPNPCPVCNSPIPAGNTLCCSRECQLKYNEQERIGSYLLFLAGDITLGRESQRQAILWRDQHCCTECGCSDEWMGKQLTLEVDHIDGDHTNDMATNLRTLCPNCHSQTATYKAKNTGNGRPYFRENHR